MNYPLRLLVEVARMRHMTKLTQQEIADRLELSRPTISRVLSQAEERGIIKISVVDPFQDISSLENQVKDEFGLKEVRIVNTLGLDEASVLAQLGRAGAECLMKLLQPNDTLGVAWGRTTREVAKQMPPFYVEGVRVVSLNGCTYEKMLDEDLFEVERIFCRKLGGKLHLMYAPVIVASTATKAVYLAENHMSMAMNYIEKSRIIINGIGKFHQKSMLYRYGYINKDEWAELERKGSVGNFCSLYYDIDGNLSNPELCARTIGISLEHLKTKEYSIGVAHGQDKVPAILGALRGRFINIFITGEETARALLDMHRKVHKPRPGNG